MAYGSIVSVPGREIADAVDRVVDRDTPFPVEYARSSKRRTWAPTVVEVPEGYGSPVKAKVFVLKEHVTEQQALDMLYRREINMVGDATVTYDDARQRKKRDGVVIDSRKGLGVGNVLYTTLRANMPEILDNRISIEDKGRLLADKARASLTEEEYRRRRDGIQYLADNIDQGIITPLTTPYCQAILSAIPGSGNLRSARLRLASERLGVRIVAGVDGCKAGWFAVWGDGAENWTFGVFSDFASLWQELAYADLIVVDIPIGLPSDSPRTCDLVARKLLRRPRHSSVFPVPCRQAVHASSEDEAKAANKRIMGKSISRQCLGICSKIAEVDRLLLSDTEARQTIREGHPEVSFYAFAGSRPMEHKKSIAEGVGERLAVLRERWSSIDDLFKKASKECRRGHMENDDVLDAAAMYLTAAAEESRAIPTKRERDSEGLAMEMVVPPCIPLG